MSLMLGFDDTNGFNWCKYSLKKGSITDDFRCLTVFSDITCSYHVLFLPNYVYISSHMTNSSTQVLFSGGHGGRGLNQKHWKAL